MPQRASCVSSLCRYAFPFFILHSFLFVHYFISMHLFVSSTWCRCWFCCTFCCMFVFGVKVHLFNLNLDEPLFSTETMAFCVLRCAALMRHMSAAESCISSGANKLEKDYLWCRFNRIPEIACSGWAHCWSP